MSTWIKTSECQPTKNGKYLVLFKGYVKPYIRIARFADNLKRVSDYFKYEDRYDRPGWWDGDSEGDWEVDDVLAWMELPEIPDGLKEG